MNLGVYWYFDFPTGLYDFKYFEFKKGYGGHADNQAELIVNVISRNADKLIEELRLLISQHKDGFLFICKDKDNLQIGTGGYQLNDYDFELIKEVEFILENQDVEIDNTLKLENPELIMLSNETEKIIYPRKKIFQVVSSSLKKANAETQSLRMDCNLLLINKQNFISDAATLCKAVDIHVFYYFEHNFSDMCNLMMFFTNGRQGVNFKEKQYIDTRLFEDKMEELLKKHHVKPGYADGYGLYPQTGPKIELMVDGEFILT